MKFTHPSPLPETRFAHAMSASLVPLLIVSVNVYFRQIPLVKISYRLQRPSSVSKVASTILSHFGRGLMPGDEQRLLVYVDFFVVFETRFHCVVWLPWNSLCRPAWP